MTSNDERKKSDISKSELCKKMGITLIEVPFWWDRKRESLAATIFSHRPDLFAKQPRGNPIPLIRTETHKVNKESIFPALFSC
jgi:hypothetical protein